MGWLSNIFKPRTVPEAPKKTDASNEVSLKDLVEKIEKKIQEKDSQSRGELEDIRKKILDSSREFSAALSELEKSEGPSKIDEGLLKVARSYRTTLIKAFNTAFMEIEKPVNYSARDFDEYFGKCSAALGDAERGAMRYVTPLKEVFPGEMGRVLKKSDQMESAMVNAKQKLERKLSETRPLLGLLNMARELESHASRLLEMEAELSGSQSLVADLRARKTSTEEKISQLVNSDEWADHQRKVQDLALLEKKRNEISSVILQSVVSIERAMKKLRKLISDGRESIDDVEMLDLYINDSLDAFMRDEDQAALKQITSKIKSASGRGVLEINDKKGEKILERTVALESSNLLPGLKNDYERATETAAKMSGEIKSSEVLSTNSRYAEELKSILSSIPDAEENQRKTESVVAKIRDKKSELSSKLEEAASNTLGEGIRIYPA